MPNHAFTYDVVKMTCPNIGKCQAFTASFSNHFQHYLEAKSKLFGIILSIFGRINQRSYADLACIDMKCDPSYMAQLCTRTVGHNNSVRIALPSAWRWTLDRSCEMDSFSYSNPNKFYLYPNNFKRIPR